MLTSEQYQALAGLVRRLSRPRGDALSTPVVAAQQAALPDALVRKHLLAPLAYRAGIVRFYRDFVASSLIAELRENILAEVIAALANVAIPAVLLKGVSYTHQLYAHPGERPMSDIDLLVPPRSYDTAAQALRRLGYWHTGANRQRSPLHHAASFKRRGASVDLHWSIMQPLRSRIDVRGLWQRATPAAERSDGALRLDPVDEIVIHLGHIARHELMVPMVNYVDASRLLQRVGPARDSDMLARAHQFRLGRAVQAALSVTHALAQGRPAPGGILPSVKEIWAQRPVARPLQCLRKALLVQGPGELVGLVAVGTYGLLAHRWRP